MWLSPGLLVLVALFLEDFGGGILGVKALSRRRQSQFSILHHRVRRSRSTTASEAMASKLGPAFHTQPPSIYTFSNDSGKLLPKLKCLGGLFEDTYKVYHQNLIFLCATFTTTYPSILEIEGTFVVLGNQGGKV